MFQWGVTGEASLSLYKPKCDQGWIRENAILEMIEGEQRCPDISDWKGKENLLRGILMIHNLKAQCCTKHKKKKTKQPTNQQQKPINQRNPTKPKKSPVAL